MDRRYHKGSERRLDQCSSFLRYAKSFSKQGPSGARSQTNHHLRLNHGQFRSKPGTARADFGIAGLFMDAALSALGRFPLEVLHNIRDIDFGAIDTSGFQRPIEHPAGGADKGMPFSIFLISRLLANHHDGGSWHAFAKNSLGRSLPKIAGLAIAGGMLQIR